MNTLYNEYHTQYNDYIVLNTHRCTSYNVTICIVQCLKFDVVCTNYSQLTLELANYGIERMEFIILL